MDCPLRFLNNSDYLPSFSYSVILATFGIERDSGSKVTLKYSFTRHFASSIPVTCAPSVINVGIVTELCSLSLIYIVNQCCISSRNFVGSNAYPDTCSADQDSSCNFSFFLFYFRLFLCFVFVFFRFRRFSLYLQLQVHPKRIDCNAKCFR